MSIKLVRKSDGWVVQLLKRRGKSKIVAVDSVFVKSADPDLLLTAVEAMKANQSAIADARRS